IPPSNPDKPWWGLAATVLMTSAYGLSKAREKRLIQLMPEYRESTRTDWLLNKLWHGLRLHKEAYSAEVDYEFHKWAENRKARGAQLAAMSPQELAIYQQQVRLQAEVQAQAQLQAINSQPA
ncbi:MAG: type IV secretory system conjugative DNA transfer family protein, partial [Nostoc sp.]